MSKLPSIYGLIDPRDGTLRYIGKANTPAARLKGHVRDARRRHTPLYAWMRKLAKTGLMPGLIILEAEVPDWREAERRQIADARSRSVALLNLAEGGDEPFCSPEVRSANGKRLVGLIRSDPAFRQIWAMKRNLNCLLRDGLVSNVTRAKLRRAARARPDLFGLWSNIPDRQVDERGHPIGGYGRTKGGRIGAPLQALS